MHRSNVKLHTTARVPKKRQGIRLPPDGDTHLSVFDLDGLFEGVDMPSAGHVGSVVAAWLVLLVNVPPGVPAFASTQHNGRGESALELPAVMCRVRPRTRKPQTTNTHKASMISCVDLYASRIPR